MRLCLLYHCATVLVLADIDWYCQQSWIIINNFAFSKWLYIMSEISSTPSTCLRIYSRSCSYSLHYSTNVPYHGPTAPHSSRSLVDCLAVRHPSLCTRTVVRSKTSRTRRTCEDWCPISRICQYPDVLKWNVSCFDQSINYKIFGCQQFFIAH